MNGIHDKPDEHGVVNADDQSLAAHRPPLLLLVTVCITILAAPLVWTTAGGSAFVLLALVAGSSWIMLALVRPNWTAGAGLAVILALLLRVPMLLTDPDLSGDVWRYLWDGTVSAQGIDPYSYAPDDIALESLRTPWHREINHSSIPTIYPPAAQILFQLIGVLGGSLLFWRLLLMFADVALILYLRRRSSRAALLWAVCPLAVWEGIWNAHLDLLVAAALVVAVSSASPSARATALAVTTGLKLMPGVALPAFIAHSRTRGRFLAIFLTVLLLPVLPYAGADFMPGLSHYARDWSFNGPVFTLLVETIDALQLHDGVRSLWTVVKDPLRLGWISEAVYARLHPGWIARAILGIALLLGAIRIAVRARDLPTSTVDTLGLLLVLSPTVHPWYWLPVTIVALHAHRPAWLFLAAASPVSYLIYEGVSLWAVIVASWILPAIIWLLWRRARRGRAASRSEKESQDASLVSGGTQ